MQLVAVHRKDALEAHGGRGRCRRWLARGLERHQRRRRHGARGRGASRGSSRIIGAVMRRLLLLLVRIVVLLEELGCEITFVAIEVRSHATHDNDVGV